MLTANEFRALSIAAERADIPLIVETDDPLRRQLATLFGIPVLWPEAHDLDLETPASFADLPPKLANGVSDGPEEALDLESQHRLPSRWRLSLFRHPAPPDRKWLKRLLATAGSTSGGSARDRSLVVVCWQCDRHYRSSQTETVSGNLNFVVVEPGAPMPQTDGVTVQGEPVSFDLQVSLVAPSTGEVTIGESEASGQLVLRNAGGEPVELAAGQRFQSLSGFEYVLSETAVVPGATPDSSPGEMTMVISKRSSQEPRGNLDIGLLSGRLESGVYFQ